MVLPLAQCNPTARSPGTFPVSVQTVARYGDEETLFSKIAPSPEHHPFGPDGRVLIAAKPVSGAISV